MDNLRAIGLPLTARERDALISAARAHLGVKFRHQGRSMRGVDCAGLIASSLSNIGRPIRDCPAYGREPLNDRLDALLFANLGDAVPREQMQAGDVVLMRFRGQPCHVALVTAYPSGGFAVIHSYAQVKKVVEHRIDSEWAGYIVKVYRP